MRELFHGEDGSYVVLGKKAPAHIDEASHRKKMAVRPRNEKPPNEWFLLTNSPGFQEVVGSTTSSGSAVVRHATEVIRHSLLHQKTLRIKSSECE